MPAATPERYGIRKERQLPYGDEAHPERHLDVWVPPGEGPFPAVLYIHGGGFRSLSKDTHWLMALAFARRGFVVFNIDYRLAPKSRFPAAAEDACAAWCWVLENAHRWGVDVGRLVVSGESAGANLALVVTLAACTRRPEPWARRVFDAGVAPVAVVPACGMLQVSDPGRFSRRKPHLPSLIQDVIDLTSELYLPMEGDPPPLADPLLVFEAGQEAARPWPRFFLPVGTRDPILDDTRRLAVALERSGARAELRCYPGGVHAFHAMIWQRRARDCWRDVLGFVEEVAG